MKKTRVMDVEIDDDKKDGISIRERIM